jgi:hypothetical protein
MIAKDAKKVIAELMAYFLNVSMFILLAFWRLELITPRRVMFSYVNPR